MNSFKKLHLVRFDIENTVIETMSGEKDLISKTFTIEFSPFPYDSSSKPTPTEMLLLLKLLDEQIIKNALEHESYLTQKIIELEKQIAEMGQK